MTDTQPLHDPEMIDVEYATSVCNCEPQSIIERLRSGELPGLKFGRSWAIPRRAFFDRLNEIALAESELRRKQRASTNGVMVTDEGIVPMVQAAGPIKRPRGRPRKHIQVGNTT